MKGDGDGEKGKRTDFFHANRGRDAGAIKSEARCRPSKSGGELRADGSWRGSDGSSA